MTAVIAGLTVAVIWTIGTLLSARASREVGAPSALGAVMLVGLVACVPLLLISPAGPSDAGPYLPWLLVAGGGNLVGLLLNYTALTRGNVSIVAPITATEGAIAATIAILAGEPVTAALILALTVVVVGVILTAWGPEGDPASGRPGGPLFLAMAVGSAMLFGASLYAVGHASQSVPGAWVVVAGRILGTLFVALPLLLTGRFRMTRAVLPLVIVCGLIEVVGFLTITWGAKDSIAITAVLSSQFAVIVPLVSMVVFKERMLRHQLLGALLTGLGVAGVTLAQL
ncbi:MAG: EamA family transporter [Candidatus Limnocylindrales bacterium]